MTATRHKSPPHTWPGLHIITWKRLPLTGHNLTLLISVIIQVQIKVNCVTSTWVQRSYYIRVRIIVQLTVPGLIYYNNENYISKHPPNPLSSLPPTSTIYIYKLPPAHNSTDTRQPCNSSKHQTYRYFRELVTLPSVVTERKVTRRGDFPITSPVIFHSHRVRPESWLWNIILPRGDGNRETIEDDFMWGEEGEGVLLLTDLDWLLHITIFSCVTTYGCMLRNFTWTVNTINPG